MGKYAFVVRAADFAPIDMSDLSSLKRSKAKKTPAVRHNLVSGPDRSRYQAYTGRSRSQPQCILVLSVDRSWHSSDWLSGVRFLRIIIMSGCVKAPQGTWISAGGILYVSIRGSYDAWTPASLSLLWYEVLSCLCVQWLRSDTYEKVHTNIFNTSWNENVKANYKKSGLLYWLIALITSSGSYTGYTS
jgi:hypothetical protein